MTSVECDEILKNLNEIGLSEKANKGRCEKNKRPTPNAADPPVAEGERGALSQLGSGLQWPQVKPGGSADLTVRRQNRLLIDEAPVLYNL